MKSYDTEATAARLGPLLHEGTAVVSLQNGVDNEEKIAAAVGWEHVLGGSAYILAEVKRAGRRHGLGPRRIVFGEWAGGEPSARVRALLEVASAGGIPASAAVDVRVTKWEKFTLLSRSPG